MICGSRAILTRATAPGAYPHYLPSMGTRPLAQWETHWDSLRRSIVELRTKSARGERYVGREVFSEALLPG